MSEWNNHNQQVISAFRTNRDNGGPTDRPLVILTTTGAKSGKLHETPVRAFFDGDTTYVIASKGGAPSHPDWYRNLVAHPDVKVEVGKDTFNAKAVVATGTERERLYANAVAIEPGFGEYQSKTTREIPVVILQRK